MFPSNSSSRAVQNRTTTPNSFDVYRSLPVSAQQARMGASSSPNAENPILIANKDAVHDETRSSIDVNSIPYPPVPLASLSSATESVWLDEIDLEKTRSKLAAVCSKCELRRTPTSCEFVCTAQINDGGNERCNFIINVWRVPENEEAAGGKYLVQVDRSSGCPYFFRQVMGKTFDVPEFRKCQGRLFRVPKLPECLCDQGEGIRKECVEAAINLATSDVYEQRIQGLNALADLCAQHNPTFVEYFVSAQGVHRIEKLKDEPDRIVQRAVERILSSCA